MWTTQPVSRFTFTYLSCVMKEMPIISSVDENNDYYLAGEKPHLGVFSSSSTSSCNIISPYQTWYIICTCPLKGYLSRCHTHQLTGHSVGKYPRNSQITHVPGSPSSIGVVYWGAKVVTWELACVQSMDIDLPKDSHQGVCFNYIITQVFRNIDVRLDAHKALR